MSGLHAAGLGAFETALGHETALAHCFDDDLPFITQSQELETLLLLISPIVCLMHRAWRQLIATVHMDAFGKMYTFTITVLFDV